MKFKAIVLSLLVSSSAFAKPAEVIKKAIASSARVSVGGVVGGSAVAAKSVGNGTLFFSNDHVCQWSRGAGFLKRVPNYVAPINSVEVELIFADGSSTPGKVVFVSNVTNPKKATDITDDLCLIYVDKKYPIANIIATDVEVGEEVFSVGAPHGWFPHVAGGYTSAYSIDRVRKEYVGSASLLIGQGSSGGGVFSKETGELIGVAFAIEAADKNVPAPLFAYYVPASRARSFLLKYENSLKDKK